MSAMNKIKIILFGFFIGFFFFGQAQNKDRKWELNGYISYLNSNMFDSIGNPWLIDNQFYNRLNFSYYINDNLNIDIQMRNRLMYGNTMIINPLLSQSVDADNGWGDLSFNVIDEQNLILNMYFDRANIHYSKDKIDFRLGRQRINWGISMAWNPNDIFNSYSFFDFDYEERPGSDAVRFQYYTGPASSLEFAAKVNQNEEATAAVKWLVNKWNYDLQMIAGEVDQKDYYAGMGWAGNIWNLGFKGESAYFIPMDKKDSVGNVFIATTSLDYAFNNSLYLMAQVMYAQIPDNSPIKSFEAYYNAQLNAKYLSFTEWNIFAQLSYPITPLISASLSGMMYPQINGFFVNPMVSFSLADNLDASLVYQFFKGDFPNSTGVINTQQFNLAFIRMRWSF